MNAKGKARTVRGWALAAALLPPLCLPAAAQAPAQQSPQPASPGVEQAPPRAGIRVAPVILAEPEVETAVSISVGPEGTLPRQTFLRVRGLPQAARLTEGHPVSPGVWAVPLSALPSLRVHAPLSSSGRTEIHLSLIAIDGGVLAETKSSLVVAPAWLLGTGDQRQDLTRNVPQTRPEPPTPAVTAPTSPPQPISPVAASTPASPAPVTEPRTIPAVVAPPPPPPPAPVVAQAPPPPPAAAPVAPPPPRVEPQAPVVAALPPPAPNPSRAAPPPPPPVTAAPATPPPPVLTPADRERAEGMIQRGDSFWKQGNFAAARQFFRRAADMGLAAGALRMGATYDPVELASLNVVGLQSDPKEAAQWYERARELGAPEASGRLSRFQNR